DHIVATCRADGRILTGRAGPGAGRLTTTGAAWSGRGGADRRERTAGMEGSTMRRLGGGRFAVTAIWRLAAFVALSLAGPWIAKTVQQATQCTATEGACAAISVATGTLLRPLILILLGLALLRPCW